MNKKKKQKKKQVTVGIAVVITQVTAVITRKAKKRYQVTCNQGVKIRC